MVQLSGKAKMPILGEIIDNFFVSLFLEIFCESPWPQLEFHANSFAFVFLLSVLPVLIIKFYREWNDLKNTKVLF